MTHTIFALATAPGRAGIAVVRVSGPAAGAALAGLTGGSALPPARRAAVRVFSDPVSGEVIDHGLCLWFAAPNSFTGEDVAELHVHGGPAVVAALTRCLAGMADLRPAAPGEFTRRAFFNDKLDLTQAEAIADLVDAETEAQRKQSLRQLDGELGALYEGWRAELIGLLAHAEADIDFADEDLPENIISAHRGRIETLKNEISAHLDDGHRGERLRDGVEIVILGQPNVGKSSLLNKLARREAAIVSTTAGTTRDVIEVRIDVAGYPVTLADTAGLRAAADEIESEGVRRALARAERADLRLLVGAADDADSFTALRRYMDGDAVVVANKSDLPGAGFCAPPDAIAVSARTGAGIDRLLEVVGQAVAARAGLGEAPALTRARHRKALEDCVAALARALVAGADELVAEDLRLAARALGRITGRVDVEDILDVIFADFCIGK
jgi:tRNA modification GTPase